MLKRNSLSAFLLVCILIFPSCRQGNPISSGFDIIEVAARDKGSPFYIDRSSFPKNHRTLPIGVFDSGTGGLAVLTSILILDEFNNQTHKAGSDGIPDFESESFVYLADEANMPYGNYSAEGKAEFLRELVLKDVIFLCQAPVKSIVIACNTATAFGLDTVRKAMDYWGLRIGDRGFGIRDSGFGVEISGIVEAGSRQALEVIESVDKNISLVGVLATMGTCSSGAYPAAIYKFERDFAPEKEIIVVQQAGIGLAGAIDGDLNYIDPNATSVRDADMYYGPDLKHPEFPIELSLWELYNFNEGNELLIEEDASGSYKSVQLNSVTNYVRYMLTHLFVSSLDKNPEASLDALVLGCTHYPFIEMEIIAHLDYLKNQDEEYERLISPDLVVIDPAKSLAIELYESLKESDMFLDGKASKNLFFISVPNPDLAVNQINDLGEFPYEWKYGREINTMMEFVKRVPFSKDNIKSEVIERIKSDLPACYIIMDEGIR